MEKHRDPTLSKKVEVQPDQLSKDDLQVLLFELTKSGNVDELQQCAQYYDGHDYILEPARVLAVNMGLLPMVEILCQWDYNWLASGEHATNLYRAVVKSENTDLFRWFLEKLRSFKTVSNYSGLASLALTTHSPDMYDEWEGFLLDSTRPMSADTMKRPQARTLIPQYTKRSTIFSEVAFRAAKNSIAIEARLIRTWHRLIDFLGGSPLDPRFLGWSLTCLAQSSNFSITLATELLRLGAAINYPREEHSITTCITDSSGNQLPVPSDPWDGLPLPRLQQLRGMTALHFAARGMSEEATRFVRFLLEHGADPNYGYAGLMPAHMLGAGLMQKWLGETWEEVVERTSKARLGTVGQKGTDRAEEDEDGPKAKRRRSR
jgi:hypothetical protein